MCGITGLFYRNGQSVERALLQRMTRAIAHRGPDGEGLWHEGPIGLGHRRLAIRDLSPTGAQPMASADDQVIVAYNGEIYNDATLKAELAREHGFVAKGSSDTEILPAGWQAWGMELFNKLEGMFAIALWDKAKQQLILARDGVGIKPLYYSINNGVLRFGSELKALLADDAQPAHIDEAQLQHFMALGYPAPEASLLSGIQQLAPGTVMVVSASDIITHKFWQPTRTGEMVDAEAALEEFLPLLRRVVQDQLVSDVPVGVLQSGGIDSSLISLSLPRDVKAPLYCASFSEKSHDESDIARALAKAANRELTIVPTSMEDAEAVFAQVVQHNDGQLADSSALPTYLVCSAIGKVARVALSGDGGDEFFAGYPTYRAAQIGTYLKPLLPASIWASLGYRMRGYAGVSEARIPPAEKLARFMLGLAHEQPASAWRRYLYPQEQSLLFTDRANPLDGYAAAVSSAKGSSIDRALLADQRYYLPADLLMKTDRMSMAHALEIRVPLLDRRIMDFAGRLSPALLLKGSSTKHLLRKAAAASGAPREVTARGKTGFNLPINQLLKGPLAELANRYFNTEADLFAPYMKPDGVRQLWAQHQSGAVNHNYVLWSLLVFAQWRQQLGSRLAG